MSKQTENNEKHEASVANKLNNFLFEKRKAMLITLVGIVVVVLVLLGYVYIASSQKSKHIETIETALLDFQKFKTTDLKNSLDSLTDEEKTQLKAKEDELIETFAPIAKKHTYAGYMANIEIAEIYFSRKDWENALNSYEQATKSVKGNYALGSALFNAGVCADELEKTDVAIDYYKKASEAYNFPFKARALFNAARLTEKNNKDGAIELYNKIAADFPNTEWANLSKSRVIQISIN